MFNFKDYEGGLLYNTNGHMFIQTFGYVIPTTAWWDYQYLGDRNMMSKTNKEKFEEVFGIGIDVTKLTDAWAKKPYGGHIAGVGSLTQYADVRGKVVEYDADNNRYKINFAADGMVGGMECWISADQIVNITNPLTITEDDDLFGGHAVVIIGWGLAREIGTEKVKADVEKIFGGGHAVVIIG